MKMYGYKSKNKRLAIVKSYHKMAKEKYYNVAKMSNNHFVARTSSPSKASRSQFKGSLHEAS